jgi:hypothetical protein
LIAILALCLVAYDPPPNISFAWLDWAFRDAQESSVLGFAEPGWFDDREVDAHMPEEIAVCIRAMSCDDWQCRKQGSAVLKAIGEPAVPYLFWGLRSRDKEVWLRCYNVLKVVADCPGCQGDLTWCMMCNGTGTLWPMEISKPNE